MAPWAIQPFGETGTDDDDEPIICHFPTLHTPCRSPRITIKIVGIDYSFLLDTGAELSILLVPESTHAVHTLAAPPPKTGWIRPADQWLDDCFKLVGIDSATVGCISTQEAPVSSPGPSAPISSQGPRALVSSPGPGALVSSPGPSPLASFSGPRAPVSYQGPRAPVVCSGPRAPVSYQGPCAPVLCSGPSAPTSYLGPSAQVLCSSPSAPLSTTDSYLLVSGIGPADDTPLPQPCLFPIHSENTENLLRQIC